ncbi:MAG: hypothetical protein JWN14_2313 [Chthonomonadales bacterium]|nr:hypothetical protein [Chthonomonadales bacterium]
MKKGAALLLGLLDLVLVVGILTAFAVREYRHDQNSRMRTIELLRRPGANTAKEHTAVHNRTSASVHSTQAGLAQTDCVRAGVFQYDISHYGHFYNPYINLYFLSVDEKCGDPSPALLRSLQSSHYVLKGGSQCDVMRSEVFDKRTKENGLFFDVNRIRFLSSTKAKVEGRVGEGFMAGLGLEYIVERCDGTWKVTRCNEIVVY